MTYLGRGLVTVLLGAGLAGAALAQSDEVKRTITQVTDDIYRFDNNFHATIFVVTEDGVVVGDPINAEAAEWVKGQIAEQTGKPITHLIMSHSHADHASGGEVFEAETVITHENFVPHIAAGDVVTAEPTLTFADSHTFETGGKTFELTYLGPGHGDDMIATVIRPDNVAFVVDVVSPNRLPFRTINATSIDDLLAQIAVVEGLDFDIMIPGHSVNGTREDASEMSGYLNLLRERVQAQLDAGAGLETIQAEVKMEEYADWGAYENWLGENIQGMVGHLTN